MEKKNKKKKLLMCFGSTNIEIRDLIVSLGQWWI